MSGVWRRFWRAMELLTRLPGPPLGLGSADEMAGAVPLYPVVGAVIGGLLAVASWLAGLLLPVVVVASILVPLSVLLTGALHEDGLADSADGIGAGANRERALRVMRDHSNGTYGGVALISAFAIRVGCWVALGDLDGLMVGLVASHVAARAGTAVVLGMYAYARPGDPGYAGQVIGATHGGHSLAGCVLAGLLCWPMGPVALGGVFAGIGVAWATGAWLAARLGGITGDVAGASTVVGELGALLACVAGFTAMA